MSNIGDYLKNTPWQEIWTCPACYHDHTTRVTACASCNTPLRCTIEREPVAVCTIIDPDDANDVDDGE